MSGDPTSVGPQGDGVEMTPRPRRWVSTIPLEHERRLYFAATLILVVWYLLDRLL
jgi:hypothetical protein